MFRGILAITLIPALLLVAWLSLRDAPPRADFVLAAPASEEPRTIDPQRASWQLETQLCGALFEGLTRLDPQTLEARPAAAQRWDVSDDRKTWTFHLHADSPRRWSDGRPVTAGDFRYAWLRALDPALEAQYFSLLFVIIGAERYFRSRGDDSPENDQPADAVGIEAEDDWTLRVRLAAPCSYFLDLTSFATLAPVRADLIERFGGADRYSRRSRRHLWTRPENILCNGPYLLKRWDFKRGLWLQRNPYFTPPAAVDSIQVAVFPDPNAALLAYQTGGVDLLRGLDTALARALKAQEARGERRDFAIGPRLATYFFRVNCTRPPLDDARVRRALSLAIDKPALCRHVLGLGEIPADTYVPAPAAALMRRRAADGTWVSYQPPTGLGAGLSMDDRVASAKAFLTEAGVDPAAREIELAFAPHPDQQRIAEAVQAMWEKSLGLRVVLRSVESKVLSQRIRALDYDVVRSDWYGDYLDPNTFLDMFTTGDGQNRTGWSSPEYDSAIAAAAEEADDAQRYALLSRAEAILCAELPVIPLYFKTGNYLLNREFEGLTDNARDVLPLHELRRRTSDARTGAGGE
ncbi:Dipeptide-binding protein DppE precursor [Phycisphaerae bacterium RAS1]|nr:Dipeptide-binding protein DppE precursor [Phycisphaerae bacterium RAS1]